MLPKIFNFKSNLFGKKKRNLRKKKIVINKKVNKKSDLFGKNRKKEKEEKRSLK